WEYACRAGTTTAFNNGTNIEAEEQIYGKCPNLDEVGWYNGNETHPVGQKQPNAWGLYDMHGNVYEFCLDWYVDYSASSVTDPTGPETGARHVERGGSRVGFASDCRSASRGISSPGDRASNSGFRVVLVPVK
ncbi:MAG: formylglycine-generating enzyme family protein, partial [Verrucomicrobia bacterium]|nr:formylglycine-generating enzyme family protein [Verrucomicrobiota bacterium]